MNGYALIQAERWRQIEVEGWTPEHDLQHGAKILEAAATSYAVHGDSEQPPRIWPWAPESWKPKDRLRNLIRAGALFQAAAEASDRYESLRHWGQCDLVAAEVDRLAGPGGATREPTEETR